MRLFIYKTIFIFLCLIITYKLTVGNLIHEFETKIEKIYSKENLNKAKQKIRDEMENAVEKENMLNKNDAILLKKFLEKLRIEINNTN